MSAAHDQRYGGSFHACDKLRNGKPCLHVTAYGVEDNEQSLNAPVLLDSHKSRDNMLVFGGLVLLCQNVMSLYLSDYGQAVDKVL